MTIRLSVRKAGVSEKEKEQNRERQKEKEKG